MLKLNNISKTFYKNTPNERQALNSISLNLKDGDFVTIIGGNGAGKSTLLNIIAGSLMPNSGSILLGDIDITNSQEHVRAKKIGRLFQDPLKGTAPSMTIFENLALTYSRGTKKALAKAINKNDYKLFRERIATLGLGLEDRLDTKMGMLSGGQRQAITLLMATMATPELLLLDEHTAALDPVTAEKIINLTKEIVAKDNITTIMITHNMQASLELGNRTIMMNAGEIVYDIEGEERVDMTVEGLLRKFKEKNIMVSDRILLS